LANLNIYLVAQYVASPKDPTQTAQSGYITNPDNIEWDERIYITRGLRDKDAKMNVILNLTEQKIVKNSFNTDKTFEEVFTHFYEGYAEYIDDSVNKLNEALQPK
jgi:hypothetical protein